MLVDQQARPPFVAEYGLSLLLETEEWRGVFDAGQSPQTLRRNSELVGIGNKSLDFAVISHEHMDHVGGLSALKQLLKDDAPVYMPAGVNWRLLKSAEDLGLNVKRLMTGTRAAKAAFITSQQYGPPYEQSLIINLDGNRAVSLLGCSHPGPSRMVSKVLYDLSLTPYAVVGGLHLAWATPDKVRLEAEALKMLGVKVIVPLHCSGDPVKLESSRLGMKVLQASVGDKVVLPLDL
ncbi:Metal-dependent hydrolase of the beta-lactamase superfamily [Acidilobus saccharovorans 345-15]|uniref:Metal-dependent hydrolase of the beta-lactamase superfamily n=1 Tax=Acidilobus saccharovorans (strain DSM 16705 / JCM 18335 / VKM B-2471 / 345-15) TaxID=666510 RepID=D9Q258_ACIS3|nr:Metal-dependent hydrolase of the beta-lactamase superfamily [Acidilobus saccharovorans 345-15]